MFRDIFKIKLCSIKKIRLMPLMPYFLDFVFEVDERPIQFG